MRTKWNQLRTLIHCNNLQGGLFYSIIDSDGLITTANARMIQSLHLQHPRENRTDFFKLIHPLNRKIFQAALNECSRNGTWGSADIFIMNGSYKPMKWNVFPLASEEEGKQQYFCAGFPLTGNEETVKVTYTDGLVYTEKNHAGINADKENNGFISTPGINDQHSSIPSSGQTEQLFKVFMENTPQLTWVVDEEARLITASNAFYDYFSITADTAVGKDVSAIVPDGIFRALFEKHLQVLVNNKPAEHTQKVKRADGSVINFRITIFPITDTNGRRMLGGQATEVEDTFATETLLKEANERLLLFSRVSVNAIWEWDMQTGYIFRNDALMDMIGYPQEDTRGLSWWFRRIHPDDRNRVSDIVRETTDKGKKSWEDKYRFKCADGNYKYMLDKGFVVYENGLPVRMIGSLQDITDLKELENELLNEKIRHQKNISETAIRVQENERTRIGNELHDNVNQIISTAKLFVDLLNPASKEEKQAKEKSISYLKLAVEEIRKLSKELVTPELNEIGLIKSVSTLVDDLLLTKKIKIRFTHDSDVDMLEQGKQVTLFRIIQEQFKNILSHSDASSVELLLQKKDDIAMLIIKDNGKGFNTNQARRGIGISNIYKRVIYYNGHAELISAPGEGCLLEVTIPFN